MYEHFHRWSIVECKTCDALFAGHIVSWKYMQQKRTERAYLVLRTSDGEEHVMPHLENLRFCMWLDGISE